MRSARQLLKKASFAALGALPRSLRDRLVLRSLRAPAATDDVTIKLAETTAEHQQALHLLFDAYVDCGLIARRGVPLRVTPYLLLPTTLRFVAVVRGEVVGTLSLVQDSELHLPLEGVFGASVAALRATGARIAEIGSLAVAPGHRRSGITFLLYKAMWKAAVELLDVSHLVVAVRPEIEVVYSAALRFERLADGPRWYPGLDSKSVPLVLDLRSAPETFRRAFEKSPPGRFNPYAFFVLEQHPQLRLPQSRAELELLREGNLRAAFTLAFLRPDTVEAMEPGAFEALRRALVPRAA